MGGLCKPSTTPTSGSTTNQNPAWVNQAGQDLWSSAAGLASMPYQPYNGPRIAAANPYENRGAGIVASNTGAFVDDLNAAGGLLSTVGAGTQGLGQSNQLALDQLLSGSMDSWTNPANQSAYINPYTSNVTDIAAREMNKQYDMQQDTANAAAVKGNAFGGARHGIINSEIEKNRTQGLTDLFKTGQHDAYTAGLQSYLADKNRQAQAAQGAFSGVNAGLNTLGMNISGAGAFGNLGASRQDQILKDASALSTIGQQYRDIDQANLTTAYQDYLEQREYPYRQLNFALGALRGVPYDTTQATTGTTAGTSALGQVAGLAGTALGAYKAFQGL